MRLSDAVECSLCESDCYIPSIDRILLENLIIEKGEGPKWNFNYDNFKADPTPEILLLGAYNHPNTGNNLVGGINLHYLDKKSIEIILRALPKIMRGRNLYERYWIGRDVAPEIFQKYYRTYNSKYIRGVKQGVLYPKYGFLKTTQDWLRNKLGNIFKSKQQKQKESEPRFPSDLSDIRTRLDRAVQQQQELQQQQEPQPDQQPELSSQEIDAAQRAFKKYQAQKAASQIKPASQTKPTIEPVPNKDELLDRQFDQAYDDYISNREQESGNIVNTGPVEHPDDVESRDMETLRNDFLRDEEEAEREFEESIRYYSPSRKQYIIENINLKTVKIDERLQRPKRRVSRIR